MICPRSSPAGSATAIAKGLSKDGLLLNVASTFKQLGIYSVFAPVGVGLVEGTYGVPMVGIPKEANIDGFWYNKKIFAQDGITVPSTWAQPGVRRGGPAVQGRPAVRHPGVANCRLADHPDDRRIYRARARSGAMTPIVQGKANLTDAPYLAGATAIASLGAKGYFGKGVASTDYPTGVSEFLTGNAAIWWMGSWTLANFNQPGANQIGSSNIGFFPFPSVPGGAGNDLTFMEPGESICFSKAAYTRLSAPG